jgi:hypothetical protein
MTPSRQAAYLRAALEPIKRKWALGLPLSVAEEELSAECSRRLHSKPKEVVSCDEYGNVSIKRSNTVDPVIAAVKAYSEILGKKRNDKVAGARLVGSIDPITATNWAKEWRCAVGSAEFGKRAAKRIKDDGAYRVFKIGG